MASSYAKQADDLAYQQESTPHQGMEPALNQETAASAYEDSVPVSSTALERRSMIEKALPAELALMVTDYLTINDMHAIAINNGHIGDLMGLKIKKYVDCIHDPAFSITRFKADLKRLGINTEDKSLLIHYIGAMYFLNRDASASTEGVTVKVKEHRVSSGVSVTTTLEKGDRLVENSTSGDGFTSFRFEEKERYHTDNDSPATLQYRNGVPISFQWYRNGLPHRDGDKPSAIFFRDGNIFSLAYKKHGEYFRSRGNPVVIEYERNGVVKEHFGHQDKDGKPIAGALARKDHYRDRVVIHTHLGSGIYVCRTEYLPVT